QLWRNRAPQSAARATRPGTRVCRRAERVVRRRPAEGGGRYGHRREHLSHRRRCTTRVRCGLRVVVAGPERGRLGADGRRRARPAVDHPAVEPASWLHQDDRAAAGLPRPAWTPSLTPGPGRRRPVDGPVPGTGPSVPASAGSPVPVERLACPVADALLGVARPLCGAVDGLLAARSFLVGAALGLQFLVADRLAGLALHRARGLLGLVPALVLRTHLASRDNHFGRRDLFPRVRRPKRRVVAPNG